LDTARPFLLTDPRWLDYAKRILRIPEGRLKRRDFLAASAVLSLLASSPALAAKKTAAKKPPPKLASKPANKPAASANASTAAQSEPRSVISFPDEPPAAWRAYDIRSSITLNKVAGKTRIWLPLAQYKDTPWQRSLGHSWQGNFENAGIYRDPVAEMEVFYADWKDGANTPQLQIISQVATQDRHFDITRRGAAVERNEVLRRCLQATALMPTDGLIRRTAERAIGRVKDPVAQGKAIYDWVVDNTTYDPLLPGCGIGDIATMLESGRPGGKSADIALLFVALCRSMGIPARPVFGLRVDYSRLFGGLGATGKLANAQHCRAEFYAPGYGWIPVDPSDVRKSILDEGLNSGDSKLVVLKKLLFGFWEMNWIGFNAAQDVDLRGTTGKTLPFLVFPQAETESGRFDSLDAERFSYSVSASRVES
jgi:transglutaminase-like putative cysteine protease